MGLDIPFLFSSCPVIGDVLDTPGWTKNISLKLHNDNQVLSSKEFMTDEVNK